MRFIALKLTGCILILLLALPASPTFASPPPPIPADRLAPAVPAAPTPVPPLPITGKVTVPALTLQQVQASHFSGVVYYGMLSAFQHTTSTSGQSGGLDGLASLFARKSPLQPEAGEAEKLLTSPRPGQRAIKPDSAVSGSSINVTNDAPPDIEPAVISTTVSGVDRTVSAYPKYDAVQTPRIHYASTTTFMLPFQAGTMPLPMNGNTVLYNLTADPLLSENPFTGGKAPKRIYCAGIAYNDYAHPESKANAIAVWYSDPADNGAWTAQPSIVDSRGPNYFVDKPSIAVSWHNGTDLGYVYVAYVSYDYVNNNSAIVVATSTDGANFTVHPPIAYGGGPYSATTVGNPQVVVDTNSGAVYVLWVDFGAHQIQMAASPAGGSSFGAHEVAGSGIHVGTINGNLRAETVPMARYNSANSTLDLVWHADGTNGTDIDYSYRTFSVGGGWHQYSQPVVQFTANDQFMPSLDFNSSGDVVLTYYDRHNDPQNLAYRVYEKEIYYWGDPLDTVDNLMGGDFSLVPNTGVGGTNPPPFVGDFQDVWDWTFADGEKATASWIGIPSGIYDMFVTRITY